jgi:putative holliday junction resolvase
MINSTSTLLQAKDASYVPGTWLGVDVGTGLIGVAVGSTLTQSARPLTCVPWQPEDQCWRMFAKIEQEWQPAGYAVGLPLTLEGAEQPITKLARAFAIELEARSKKPVVLVDERSSTRQAKVLFAEKRAAGQTRRKQADAVDAWAAAVILERFLLEHNG